MGLDIAREFLCEPWMDTFASRLARITQKFPGEPSLEKALRDPDLIKSFHKVLYYWVGHAVLADLSRFRRSRILYIGKKKTRPVLTMQQVLDPAQIPVQTKRQNVSHRKACERYFEWFIQPAPIELAGQGQAGTGVQAFYSRNPAAQQLLRLATDNFLGNIELACTRIRADWNDIGKIFFDGGTLLSLDKIINTGNDSHKGGKQVLILEFTYQMRDKNQATRKLVYKPSDVETDYRLVGKNTSVLKTLLKAKAKDDGYPRQSASLFEIVDKGLMTTNQQAAQDINQANSQQAGQLELSADADELKLPTYVILPRYPGSNLRRQGDRQPIDRSYGYIEFLAHSPQIPYDGYQEPYINAQLAAQPRSADTEAWDWVADMSRRPWAGHVFFRMWGRILAVSFVFQMTDLHVQNQIVSRRKPFLIDLENSFVKRLKYPVETFIPMTLGARMPKDPERVWELVDPENGAFVPAQPHETIRDKPAANQLYLGDASGFFRAWLGDDKQRDLATAYGAEKQRGYDEAIAALGRVRDPIDAWLRSIENVVARIIPEQTGNFIMKLENYWDTVLQTPAGTTSAQQRKRLEKWRDDRYQGARKWWANPERGDEAEDRNSRVYLLYGDDNNMRDFANLDVPSYYRRVNDKDLLNSRGAKVDTTDPQDDFRDSFFEHDCLWNIQQALNNITVVQSEPGFLRKTLVAFVGLFSRKK